MKHKIEIYGEGTRELISILLKNANTTINNLCLLNNWKLPTIKEIFFSEIKELGLYQLGSSNIILSNRLLEPDISMEFVNSILLHETAHYICSNQFGVTDHGTLFKDVAEEIGAPIEFTKSSVSLEIGHDTSSQLSKIKKLLALSESSNPNESRAALNKARKLMIEMNMENFIEREFIYSSVLYEAKRFSARHKVLFMLTRDISGVFSINNYSYTNKQREQRIFGTKNQVEIALYIYDYLSYTLDKEYKLFKSSNAAYGRTLESFYYGVYEEMYKKFNDKSTKESSSQEKSMILLSEDNKQKALSYFFKKNSVFTKGHGSKISINHAAYNHGKKVGVRTNIRNGIKKDKSKEKLLIG
jgi:hypothetical protein